MLLTIDSGNTNQVFAVYKDGILLDSWRLATQVDRTLDEYALYVRDFFSHQHLDFESISDVVICNVVPKTARDLKAFVTKYLQVQPLMIQDVRDHLGMKFLVDYPNEVGQDRLVGAVAAYQRYGGNSLVIDFGTATNFEVINKDGDYCGGVIAPGVNLSAKALTQAAAQLPQFDIALPARVMGTSTVEAMQSGIYWGYVGLIEGIVARMEAEQGVFSKVIATGGLASLFSQSIKRIDHVDLHLTLDGMQIIHELLKKKESV